MQAVFTSNTPATEQSVERAMLYAGALVMMRRARLDWAGQDKPAAAQAR